MEDFEFEDPKPVTKNIVKDFDFAKPVLKERRIQEIKKEDTLIGKNMVDKFVKLTSEIVWGLDSYCRKLCLQATGHFISYLRPKNMIINRNKKAWTHLFLLLLGQTNLGKSYSLDLQSELLFPEPSTLYPATLISCEGIMDKVRDDEKIIHATEFASLFSKDYSAGIDLLLILAWDRKRIVQTTKNNSIPPFNPRYSFTGATTVEKMKSSITREDVLSGFIPRLIVDGGNYFSEDEIIERKISMRDAFFNNDNEVEINTDEMKRTMVYLKNKVRGTEITFKKEEIKFMNYLIRDKKEIYIEILGESMTDVLTSRWDEHASRIACILSVLDDKNEIEQEHVIKAVDALTENHVQTANSIAFMLGTKDKKLIMSIVFYLARKKKPVKKSNISREFELKKSSMEELINDMNDKGLIKHCLFNDEECICVMDCSVCTFKINECVPITVSGSSVSSVRIDV